MAPEITDPPFLANIGFLITYRCQVACPHCVIQAGPNRTEEMSTDDCCHWIKQASRYRDHLIQSACFTGGEPFYDIDKLKFLASVAVGHGMLPTVVTNAFWADTPSRALQVLRELGDLRVISISTDPHHQSQIPFGRVENALRAAQSLGLFYNAAVCTEDENSPVHLEWMRRLEEIIPRDRIRVVITFPVGRALLNARSLHYASSEDLPDTACTGAGTPTIFPDGRVYSCIGPVIALRTRHPLLLGNLHEKSLAEILDDAETNVALHILRVWGPAKLLSILQERGAKTPPLLVKSSMCNLCHSLMANSEFCQASSELSADRKLAEKIAYARLHYLNETRMIEGS